MIQICVHVNTHRRNTPKIYQTSFTITIHDTNNIHTGKHHSIHKKSLPSKEIGRRVRQCWGRELVVAKRTCTVKEGNPPPLRKGTYHCRGRESAAVEEGNSSSRRTHRHRVVVVVEEKAWEVQKGKEMEAKVEDEEKMEEE